MSYQIDIIPHFKRRAKKLIKKFPSLKNELAELGKELAANPTHGTHIADNIYKIRLAIKSKGKGKSGGARVITHVYVEKTTVYLLDIYDKSDQETISDKQLKELLESLNL